MSTIHDKITNGAYNLDLPHVTKRQFEVHYWYRGEKCVAKKVGLESNIQVLDERVGNTIELGACTHGIECDMEAFRDAKHQLIERDRELREKFKVDLLEHLDMQPGVKADMLLGIVFGRGEGEGLLNIVALAEQLAPLAK